MREFGGYNPKEDFKDYSNLITLNGDTDPWLPGCLQDQVNEDMPVLTVRNGAHHTDSFMPIEGEDQVGKGSNLHEVRAQVESYLTKWFAQYAKERETAKAKGPHSLTQLANAAASESFVGAGARY